MDNGPLTTDKEKGMTKTSEPIVLDLATLPREQLGPFLLLGLDKSADSVLGQLAYRYGIIGNRQGRGWQPLDVEKDVANYTPLADVPDKEEIRSALTVPDVPQEMPAVATLLERLAQVALDPWGYELPRMETTVS
jgi:hypothetical protein